MVSRNFSRVKSKTNYYIGQQKVPVDLCHPKKIFKNFLLKLPETWNKLKKFWPSPKHLEYFCIFTYTFVARNDARKVSHTHFLMSANFDISSNSGSSNNLSFSCSTKVKSLFPFLLVVLFVVVLVPIIHFLNWKLAIRADQ